MVTRQFVSFYFCYFLHQENWLLRTWYLYWSLSGKKPSNNSKVFVQIEYIFMQKHYYFKQFRIIPDKTCVCVCV